MSVRHRSSVAGSARTSAAGDPEDVYSEDQIKDLRNRNNELEVLVSNLRNILDISRLREKRLARQLEHLGVNVSLNVDLDRYRDLISDESAPPHNFKEAFLAEQTTGFYSSVFDRGKWLVGLLLCQSFSTILLAKNEHRLKAHPAIIYFLTMLVGAGGNAGNQASVRAIRGIACGSLSSSNSSASIDFICKEFAAAILLSLALAIIAFIRSYLSSHADSGEAIAITVSLLVIVFISIITGSVLPLLLQLLKIDPANASTIIQVVMDILGVLITMVVTSYLLE